MAIMDLAATACPPLTRLNRLLARLSLKAEVLRREFARGGELQQLLLRYTQALMAQIMEAPRRRVAVIMQRRVVDHPWQGEVRGPVGVLENYAGAGERRVLVEGSGITQWVYPGFDIVLQRCEAEGYFHNVSSVAPNVFVRWRAENGRPVPHYVTVSCDEASRWMGGGAQVDPVPMPAAMRAWVRAVVEQNYRPGPNRRTRPQSFLLPRERHETS